ncbi:hypothetical protein BDP27DRAFT_559605 [Rhodocollybia butyracea]|uniref:Uncharacterized protein n=1 Tax=Rhodocollybia butyracea TaxID=206335 RepID=A0A9P5UAC2_9AGAR|nr:hypothetical protein BDP27DRAFT_559605 [Rhodocollybia butyracea]
MYSEDHAPESARPVTERSYVRFYFLPLVVGGLVRLNVEIFQDAKLGCPASPTIPTRFSRFYRRCFCFFCFSSLPASIAASSLFVWIRKLSKLTEVIMEPKF